MAAQPLALEPGDLVWAHVRGYPRWPGQVADSERAQQRHLNLRKPNTLLVFFFGDRSFGWFGPDMLEPFEENFSKYCKQKAKNQNFKLAVEEGKEVLDVRAGRTPETQHHAWDYLDKEDERNQPGYDPDTAAAEAAAALAASIRVDIRPKDVDSDTARAADLPAVVAWAREAARRPLDLCKSGDEAVQSLLLARLAFGLLHAGCIQAPDGETRNPVGRPPGSKSKPHLLKADVSSTPEGERPFKKRKKGDKADHIPKPVELNDDEATSSGDTAEEDDQEARDAAEALQAVKKDAHKARRAEQKLGKRAEMQEKRELLEAQRQIEALEAWAEEALLMEERGKDNVEEEIDVDLQTVQASLLTIARSPLSYLDGRVGTAAAAALRFREAMWCMSCSKTDGIVGDCLLRVLGCPNSVKFKREAKPRVHLSLRMPDLEGTKFKVGDKYKFMKYEEFVPEGTPQQFLDRLAAFFEDKGARLPPRARVAQNAALNLSQLFRLVAQRGGYQAVTANWGWRRITSELRGGEAATPAATASVRMQYQKLLLAYEHHLCTVNDAGSNNCVVTPRRTAVGDKRRAQRPTSGRPGAPGHGKGAHQPSADGGAASSDSAALDDGDSDKDAHHMPSDADDDGDDTDESLNLRRTLINRLAENGIQRFDSRTGKIARKRHSTETAPKPTAFRNQNLRRTAAMLSDFESLESVLPAAPAGPELAHDSSHSRPPPVAAEPQSKGDGKATVLLSFPAGYPMPSRAQLLLAGTNFGPLDQSQVIVVQHRYSALLHYTNTTEAKEAATWFASYGHSKFRLAPGEVLTVKREARREQGPNSGGRRPGAASRAHTTSAASKQSQGFIRRPPGRPTATANTEALQGGARTGVPFQPQSPAGPQTFDFANDSANHDAGGSSMGLLLGASSGNSTGHAAGFDPRRLLQESGQQGPQVPLPADPRRSTMTQRTPPLSQQFPQHQPPQHHPQHAPMFMQPPHRPGPANYTGAMGPHQQPMHPGQQLPQGANIEQHLQHQHMHQMHQVHQILPHLQHRQQQQQQQQQQLPWPHTRPPPGPPGRPPAAWGGPMPITILASGMPAGSGTITSGSTSGSHLPRPPAPSPTPSLASTLDLAAILRSVQPARSSDSPAGGRSPLEEKKPLPAVVSAVTSAASPGASPAIESPPVVATAPSPAAAGDDSDLGMPLELGSDLQDLLQQLGST